MGRTHRLRLVRCTQTFLSVCTGTNSISVVVSDKEGFQNILKDIDVQNILNKNFIAFVGELFMLSVLLKFKFGILLFMSIIVASEGSVNASTVGTYGSNPYLDTVIKNAVTFDSSANGKGIVGSFDPSLGLPIAATLGGYDHFNWVQVITRWPGFFCASPLVTAPFLDPVLGGCTIPDLNADALPFYWDEGPGSFDPGYTMLENIENNVLLFVDYPHNSFIIPGLNNMEFFTYLAGVNSDGSYDLLTMPYYWLSNVSPLIEGGGSGPPQVTRNIDPNLSGEGSVFGGREGNFNDISQEQLILLRDSGARNVDHLIAPVPLPSSGTALLLCLLLLSLLSYGYIKRSQDSNS